MVICYRGEYMKNALKFQPKCLIYLAGTAIKISILFPTFLLNLKLLIGFFACYIADCIAAPCVWPTALYIVTFSTPEIMFTGMLPGMFSNPSFLISF
jgi:hypothetical protein